MYRAKSHISTPYYHFVLVDAVPGRPCRPKGRRTFFIKGPAGNGNTVSLKRAAWEAACPTTNSFFMSTGQQEFV